MLQRPHTGFQFDQHIPQTQEVGFGVSQPALRLVFAETVFGDTGRLFENFTAVGGFGRYDIRHTSLPDDGITVPTETGIHKQKLNVAQTNVGVVEHIIAVARTVVPTGDADFIVVKVQLAVGVVDGQRYLRKAE